MHDTESNTLQSRRRKRAEADIRVLLEAWDGLRPNGKEVPLWSSFDPVLRFPHLVGHLFVMALEASGGWRIRLVGSALRGVLAQSAGQLLHDVYPPSVMQIFTPRLEQITATRLPMQVRQAAVYERVVHSLGLLLPFHQGDFLVTRVVAAILYLDDFQPGGPLLGFSSDIARADFDLVD